MYHVFIDGNKRTAITVASIFLHANGHEINLPVEESEQFMIDVVVKKSSIEEIAQWLQSNSRTI